MSLLAQLPFGVGCRKFMILRYQQDARPLAHKHKVSGSSASADFYW